MWRFEERGTKIATRGFLRGGGFHFCMCIIVHFVQMWDVCMNVHECA